jgi:hypothetical protein
VPDDHAIGQELRRPFLYLAVVLAALVVAVEVGSHFLVTPRLPGNPVSAVVSSPDGARQFDSLSDSDKSALESRLGQLDQNGRPPGLAIPDLAFLDGLLLLSLVLVAFSLLNQEIVGRLQGVVNLIVSIVVIVAAFVAAIYALAKLILMLTLFLSAPFGTIAYLVLFGFFDRHGATVAISLVMFLKLALCAALVIAQPRFLEKKGLVFFLLLSLVLTLVVGFLQGIVPLPLVSITDALAGIIVSIVAIVWAVVTLVGAILAIVKAIAGGGWRRDSAVTAPAA